MHFNNTETVLDSNFLYNMSNQVQHVILLLLTCDAPLIGAPPVHCFCFQSQEGISNAPSSSCGIPHIKLLPRLLISEVRQLFHQAKSSVPHSSYCSTKMQQNSEWSHWSIPVLTAARLADTYLSWSFSMALWDLVLLLVEGSWMDWVEVDCLSVCSLDFHLRKYTIC